MSKTEYERLMECADLVRGADCDLDRARGIYMDVMDDDDVPVTKRLEDVMRQLRLLAVEIGEMADERRPKKKFRLYETVTFYHDVEIPADADPDVWLEEHE